MHPILIRIGDFAIHTYGVLVAVGFLLGLSLAAARAKKQGIDPERISSLGVWLIVSGMLGGKLFHLLFYWPDFIAGLREAGGASLREGFVFHGGLVAASLATILYTRHWQLPLFKVADILAPCLALGHAFGRLGCFANGCCYGKSCHLPWAVRFPAPHFAEGLPIHPTQLYEAAANLVLFFGLSTSASHKRYDGQVWWRYLLGYGLARFVIEFYRGDYPRYYFGAFTVAHFVSGILVLVAAGGLAWGAKHAGRRSHAAA